MSMLGLWAILSIIKGRPGNSGNSISIAKSEVADIFNVLSFQFCPFHDGEVPPQRKTDVFSYTTI